MRKLRGTKGGWGHVYLWTLACAAFAPGFATAISAPYVPDEELARQTIIVVAKWNKAPLRVHSRTEDHPEKGKVLKDCEVHTELVVERVIKGDIKPGTHKILLGFRIGWPREGGGPVMSFMSTEMLGDVEEVTESNLWFLVPKRSWDKSDPKTYFALETYRGVQPIQLETYFHALGSKNPKDEIPKLLSTQEPLVLKRVLTFLSGGVLPWPYEPGLIERHQGVKRRREPMPQHAPAVEKLLERKQPEVRRLAAAVYAELAGKTSVARMRQLLGDPDATIRAIAIGILVRHEDRVSGEAIGRAARGIKDGWIACEVIELLRKWKNLQTVPALIEFLQNDAFAYEYGDDLGVPALKAQIALKELTGYDFPLHVESSRNAWEKARAMTDVKKRAKYLAQILPCDPEPLVGKLIKDEKGEALMLSNRSAQVIMVTKEPAGIEYQWTNGIGGGLSRDRVKSKNGFATLAPGASLRLKVNSAWVEPSRLKRLTVYYLNNGNEIELNAWIGRVVLNFDPK